LFYKDENERNHQLSVAKDYLKTYYAKNLKEKIESSAQVNITSQIKNSRSSPDSFDSTSLESDSSSKSTSLLSSTQSFSSANNITKNTTIRVKTKKRKQLSIFKKWTDNTEKTLETVGQTLIEQELKNYSQCDWSYEYGAIEDDDDEPANPLEFYKICSKSKNFKILPVLARHFFCIPATSVPAESLFSKAGQIATDLRNRIHYKRLEMYTFIKNNMSIDS